MKQIDHSYSSKYLDYLQDVKLFSETEIRDFNLKIMKWLSENNIEHSWSEETGYVVCNLGWFSYSSMLFFKEESDLVAFRLKWDIHA